MPSKRVPSMLERHGEPVTVTSYTQSGTDGYGDPTFTATTVSTDAYIERYGQTSAYRRTAGGVIPNIDVIVYLSNAVAVNMAQADAPKATRIERASGIVYRVKTVFDEANGILECGCEQLTQTTP